MMTCNFRLKRLIYRASLKGETSIQYTPSERENKEELMKYLAQMKYSVVDRSGTLYIGWSLK